MWKIGNIEIKNKVGLSPMAGVSNPSFLKICEEMELGFATTELLSAESIIRGNEKTFDMLKGIEELNFPFGLQIFGSNPQTMGKAASILEKKYKKCSYIDINMGCPVNKVVKSNAGSALLKDLDKVEEIVKEVVKSVSIPVTVKIRSGWDEKSINAVEVAKIIESSGASAICIHARTRSQAYSGHADWNIIKKVKESVNIPVIGNGDITNIFLAKKMLEETKCDAIMIGRGVLGNPWLIKNSVDYLKNGTINEEVTPIEKIEMLKKHFNLLLKNTNEKQALLEIRMHALWYLKGLPNNALIKTKICQTKDVNELFNILDDYLKSL